MMQTSNEQNNDFPILDNPSLSHKTNTQRIDSSITASILEEAKEPSLFFTSLSRKQKSAANKEPQQRRFSVIVILLSIVIVLISAFFVISDHVKCVTVNSVYVRVEPEGTASGFFENGDCFFIAKDTKDNDWYQISNGDFKGNWISSLNTESFLSRLFIK